MKPLLLFLLFLSGFAYADPIINNPMPFEVCDDNNDGFSAFYLHSIDNEIVMGQPNIVVSYYETMADAIANVNEIPEDYYGNIVPYSQTLYVRATDTSDNSFTTTTLELHILARPIAMQPNDIQVEDIPFDGYATFDLNIQNTAITTDAGVFIAYYTSLFDAQSGANPIPNPSSYINSTNPQTIFARVESTATGCYDTTSFRLIITNPDIVYIPDPEFKWELVHGNIATDNFGSPIILDTNADGEIQITEALQVYRLDPVNVYTTSYEGIRSFANLHFFYVAMGCNINTLDVSGLQYLTNLQCEYNQLQTLNVSNCPSLQSLFCGGNALTTLDLTGKPNLRTVWCELNQINSLDVTGSPVLQQLSCRNNNVSVLDLSNNTALTDLNCGANPITTLDVSNCHNLVNFHCAGAPLTSLNMTGLTTIENLNIRYTNLTSVDVSPFTALSQFNCDGNLFTELDLSHNPTLCTVQCSNSNTLNYLNIKNGGTCDSVYMINTNPNLQFVCADESEADYYQNSFISQGMPTIVNSYCTFVPGGSYNTITGNITFDGNSNGCDAGDLPQPFIKINIDDTTTIGSTFTNLNGSYSFYTQEGNFSLTPQVENPSWFTLSPTSAVISFADSNDNTAIQNFCLAPIGIHRDAEMVIMPVGPARPGFNATYKLVYKNKGNQTSNLYLNFSYDDAVLDVVSSSVTPTLATSGHLSWTVPGVLPFQSGYVLLTLHLNSPTDTPSLNLGDVLTFSSFVDITTDENWVDNAFTLHQTVIGSYDPNEITCLEGDSLPATEIGQYLHYGVNFENTGTYAAENVVVKDVIDTAKYDINSLQVLGASHPSYIRITGNIVEFIFRNINLDAAGGTPPVGGHGDVLFKIKSNNSLANGDYVSKSAKIYFDYNAPITTNDAQTTFATLNNPIHDFDNSVKVYPNPAHSLINISCNSTIQSVALYDIQGRLLETELTGSNEVTFDISGKTNGVYFIKITSDKGSKVEKFVKE